MTWPHNLTQLSTSGRVKKSSSPSCSAKVLTPNDFPDLRTLEAQLLKFQDRYQQLAQPFEWRFTRADLARLLSRLNRSDTLQLSA